MRYTTVIDVREVPSVARNANAMLLYFHLALAAGYHDDDRDVVRRSIRALAADTGLTVSAVRHATAVLERCALVERKEGTLKVKKWLPEKPITARTKSQAAQKRAEARAQEQRDREQREETTRREKEQREELRKGGKTPFMVYYEQKLLEAAAGDAAAQKVVDSRRAQYEIDKAAMAAQYGKGQEK